MSLFNRLFKKDPVRELDRAEAMLDDGRPYPALRVVRKTAPGVGADAALGERTAELERRCHAALAEAALAEAEFMEAEGDFDDAAEWVGSALEHLEGDDERVRELQRLRRTLRKRAKEAAGARTAGGLLGRETDQQAPSGPDPLATEVHFGNLVATLRDEVADRYLHRPLAFQQAYVDFNEGRLDDALVGYDALIDGAPEDPILRFERGRCRLMAGDAPGAREDFETVWAELGDRPFDHQEGLSVPLLWAEACLLMDDPEAVIGGLAELAGFAAASGSSEPDDPEVAVLLGGALLEADRLDDARGYLTRAAEEFPRRSDLTHLLARVLERLGDRERATAVLETAIAPACKGGSCSKPPLHRPSARMLVRLYLDGTEEGAAPPDRVGELMALLAREQGGRATLEDLRLLARYQRMSGLDEEAEETEEALRRAEEAGEEADEAAVEPADVIGSATSRPPL